MNDHRKHHSHFSLLLWLLPLLALVCAGCGRDKAPDKEPFLESLPLAAVYVHGESALLYTEAGYAYRELLPSYRVLADGRPVFLAEVGETAEAGLPLARLPEGDFTFARETAALTVPADLYLPEGYTITRRGKNLHWRFYRGHRGMLRLEVRAVDSLPEAVYDVLIDVGHGGADVGATGNGLVEAEENLRAARALREALAARGLKVLLSREDESLPGGDAAEQNPYVPGARVDAVYRSGAKYVISCHLNAGGGSGFQLYSSIRTGTAWSQAVSQRLLEAGWHGDGNGLNQAAPFLYKRPTEGRTLIPRDYYFIIRETGGYALSPYTYRLLRRDEPEALAVGAETLLVEFLFLDNAGDAAFWRGHWQELAEAVAQGAADYWQLSEDK